MAKRRRKKKSDLKFFIIVLGIFLIFTVGIYAVTWINNDPTGASIGGIALILFGGAYMT